jgi:hypothetical protein
LRYRIVNDGAALQWDLFPLITLEGPELCRCETLEETKAALARYATAGMDVSAMGWEPTVYAKPPMED